MTTVKLAEFIARNAVSEPFRQTDVMDTRTFCQWLGKRALGIDEHLLARLWSIGVVRPIVVKSGALVAGTSRFSPIELGYDEPTFVDLGRVVTTADIANPPNIDVPSRALIWHPFQIWEIDRTLRVLNVNIAPGAIAHGVEGYRQLVDFCFEGMYERLAEWSNSRDRESWEKVLAVAVYAEPLVHLRLNNQVRYRGWPQENIRTYFEWIALERARAKDRLSELEFTLEELKSWHAHISSWAEMDDPVAKLRPLLRHATRDARDGLEGAALKSDTLYDLAEVIRRYSEDFWQVNLPEEDGARHGPSGALWKQELFGSSRTGDFDRQVFRRVVRHFGLDPQARTTWFVEGETEQAFILAFAGLRQVNLEANGVELANLRGVGGLKDARLLDLLERYLREEVFAHVSVDRELHETHLRELKNLAQQDLLMGGFTIWERDFEQANFTRSELILAAEDLASAEGVSVSIDPEKVDRAIRRGKAVKRAIFDELKRQTYPGPKIGAWGAALATMAYRSPECPDGLEGVDGRRPIVALFGRMLRGQTSNFRMTLRRVRVGDTGEYVPREPGSTPNSDAQ